MGRAGYWQDQTHRITSWTSSREGIGGYVKRKQLLDGPTQLAGRDGQAMASGVTLEQVRDAISANMDIIGLDGILIVAADRSCTEIANVKPKREMRAHCQVPK